MKKSLKKEKKNYILTTKFSKFHFLTIGVFYVWCDLVFLPKGVTSGFQRAKPGGRGPDLWSFSIKRECMVWKFGRVYILLWADVEVLFWTDRTLVNLIDAEKVLAKYSAVVYYQWWVFFYTYFFLSWIYISISYLVLISLHCIMYNSFLNYGKLWNILFS